MQLVFNDQEEAAVQRYADKHNMTYGEALQKIIDAMTKGLINLAMEDDEFGINETQMEDDKR